MLAKHSSSIPLAVLGRAVALVTALLVVVVFFFRILAHNNGVFCYTLDDPYIHLALSEGIRVGHYGLNVNELSAPSSSILYPFLLALTAGTSLHGLTPLLLNTAFLLLIVALTHHLITLSVQPKSGFSHALCALAVIGLAFATNLFGLVFTGMEHSLHVATSTAILLGLLTFRKEQPLPGWLPWAIIANGLVRYEGLPLSLVAVGILWWHGHRKSAVITLSILIALVVGFSLFLKANGLSFLPSPIVLKTPVTVDPETSQSLTKKDFVSHLMEGFGKSMALWSALTLAIALALSRGKLEGRIRLSALFPPLLAAFCLLCHTLFGKWGAFDRYEIYVILIVLSVVIYESRPFPHPRLKPLPPLAAGALLVCSLVIPNGYLDTTLQTVPAAQNIYEQQYQMHRFAVEFYRAPVAINDLGWVSYQNDHYVLDIWGLGSEQVTRSRTEGTYNKAFIQDATNASQVGLAMIYRRWFSGRIPDTWLLVASLRITSPLTSAAREEVQFYVTDCGNRVDILNKLHQFKAALPPQSVLRIIE